MENLEELKDKDLKQVNGGSIPKIISGSYEISLTKKSPNADITSNNIVGYK